MKIKLSIILIPALALCGCLADPLMTGHMQDWKGHQASELKTAYGEPKRIIPRPGGAELWEYVQEGDFVSPKEKDTGFSFGGSHGFGSFGAAGGLKETETGQHPDHYILTFRYSIKNGKVTDFFGTREENGRVVHSEH